MTARIMARTLWDYRTSFLFIMAGILAFETLIALVWRSIGQQGAIAMIDAMPANLKNLVERQFGFLPTGDLAGWLAVLNRHPIYLVLVASFVVGAGAAAVAREIERGTILLVLTRPVARWRFFLAKTCAGALGLLALVLVSLVGLYAGSFAVGQSLDLAPFAAVAANGFLLFLAIAGLVLLLSALGDEGTSVAGRSAGIVLAAYFVDFLANLWSKAEFLGPISFFHYYDPAAIVRTGNLPWGNLAVLLILAAVLHAAALVVFQRRDIAR